MFKGSYIPAAAAEGPWPLKVPPVSSSTAVGISYSNPHSQSACISFSQSLITAFLAGGARSTRSARLCSELEHVSLPLGCLSMEWGWQHSSSPHGSHMGHWGGEGMATQCCSTKLSFKEALLENQPWAGGATPKVSFNRKLHFFCIRRHMKRVFNYYL